MVSRRPYLSRRNGGPAPGLRWQTDRAVDTATHIQHLRNEGRRLATVAARGHLDDPVPACPGWTVRAAVRHVGRVHRWARSHLVEHRDTRADVRATAGPMPADADLVTWFDAGLGALLDTLESTTPGDPAWHFGPAPSPLAFWARRQALETAVHRTDVESASGPVTPLDAALAADGVDETFDVFILPRDGLRSPTPLSLRLHAGDAARDWLVHIDAERVSLRREPGAAGCTASGSASDLYLLLWNRIGRDAVEIDGDGAVLDLWRSVVQVRMSGDLE